MSLNDLNAYLELNKVNRAAAANFFTVLNSFRCDIAVPKVNPLVTFFFNQMSP